ncbi:MAG TPA: hypothetical protein PKM73_10010 [Verrucomicrobiota bacterium]|nr:hypothetical protein [Verrucomicrobiota bacterium]HNU51693.1 hypothetical protein [Verrucomicrobiota bacterium]
MKTKRRLILPVITALIAGAACAVAQDIRNYSWSGTSMTPPTLYAIDSNGNPPPTYEMANNRLHAANPGSLGAWSGKQFDWPADSFLADHEKISGSLTFRINSVSNSGGLGERLRLFVFNTAYANGLPATLLIYASDSKVDRGPNAWRPGGHPEWNKWEMNSDVAVCPAPAGKTYLYNSFNMKNPATDPDYCRLIDNGVDHVLSWSAQYDAANHVVNVQTWLDGVSWTLTAIGMQYPDWFLNGGWPENALAKAWPNMGAWDVEFSEIKWETTTATSDIKNYWWTGTSGGYPTVYAVDSNGNPPPTYEGNWETGRLHAANPGSLGAWSGKQFDWPADSFLADHEKISGSLTFRINSVSNSGGLGERLRLFVFNTAYANGLPATLLIYASDSKVDNGPGNWRPGGHGEWNKWEMNSSVAVAPAPAGKTYLYNSFNMKNPATDPDYCRLIDNGVDHVLSWSAQYDAVNNVVNVQTWLDGVSWTLTAIGMQYPDWFLNGGWPENALAKAWPNMGAWDVEFSEIKWETTTATSDIKNYWWTGTSGGYPTVYTVDSNGNPPPTYEGSWQTGRLHAANPGALGAWSGKQFDWPCASGLADDEMISGSVTFRINSLANSGDLQQRLRLFTFNVPWANGMAGILHIMAADHRASRSDWKPGGHAEWNKWEMNSTESLEAAPAGMTYLYNSWNMDDPATDADYCRAISNGVDCVLSWTMQYLPDRVRVTTALDGVPWTVCDIGSQSPDWFLNCGWPENAMSKAWPNMGAWDVEWSEIRWTTTKAAPNICWTKYPPSGQWEIRWYGTRQRALDINGPWEPAGGASPATPSFAPPAPPIRFWRSQGLQCP